MICSLFTQDVEAKDIGYGAIGRDRGPGCSPTHPENCKDKPANPYTR
ncbi:protein RALF-like 9-like, partial [Trifolium medium]|nr:protein RALF-like 9-like [Trifolium medium]